MSERRTSIDAAAFAYRSRKSGEVEISHYGRPVIALRAEAAAKFVNRIEGLEGHEAQHLMARVTGNFKRGNERQRNGGGRRAWRPHSGGSCLTGGYTKRMLQGKDKVGGKAG